MLWNPEDGIDSGTSQSFLFRPFSYVMGMSPRSMAIGSGLLTRLVGGTAAEVSNEVGETTSVGCLDNVRARFFELMRSFSHIAIGVGRVQAAGVAHVSAKIANDGSCHE
jgi:hypothetical protein